MTDELMALGRRAVACKGWRWMAGMQCLVGPSHAPYRYVTHDYAPPEGNDVGFTDPLLPGLTDPATLGCLLALVREAWGDPSLTAAFDYEGWPSWRVGRSEDGHGMQGVGDTEAEALVAALEAAPNTSGEHRREEEHMTECEAQPLRDEFAEEIRAAYRQGYADGVDDERAAAVAWLTKVFAAASLPPRAHEVFAGIWDAIERGEHRREEEP